MAGGSRSVGDRWFSGFSSVRGAATTPWNRKHVGLTMRLGTAGGGVGSIEIFLVRGIAPRLISLPRSFIERDTNFLSFERRVCAAESVTRNAACTSGVPRARNFALGKKKGPRHCVSLRTRRQFTEPRSELIAVKRRTRGRRFRGFRGDVKRTVCLRRFSCSPRC